MNPIVEGATRDHEDDIAAIRQLIADVETGFNTNDAELLVSPFIRDGSAVNVAGVLLSGFPAMLENARAGLAGPLRNRNARYELADVVCLRPDVAGPTSWPGRSMRRASRSTSMTR
jgi:uncharacterized protein (TIGR02246 family)